MTKQLIYLSTITSVSLDKATLLWQTFITYIHFHYLPHYTYECIFWLHIWYPRLVFVPKPQITPKAENCMKIEPPIIKNFVHTSWSTKTEINFKKFKPKPNQNKKHPQKPNKTKKTPNPMTTKKKRKKPRKERKSFI